MQLVKLTYFVDDEAGTSKTKNIQYKVQQIALAMELEKNSSKEDIFTTVSYTHLLLALCHHGELQSSW